ncbi:unnamed protein product [Peniophora sp. CBMAI 1063]|nr:unnamed protein product [Peniophora sp. CBMAI 1063]
MFPITYNAFGDIVSMIGIIYSIAQALNDSRGSPSEYRSFVFELRAFASVLEEIAALHISSPEAASIPLLDGVNACCEVLEEARSRVDRYHSLDELRSSVSLQNTILKLRWRLLKRDEAEQLRKKLHSRLELLLALVDRHEFSSVQSHLRSINVQSEQIHAAVTAVKHTSRQLLARSSTVQASMDDLGTMSSLILRDTSTMRMENASLRDELVALRTAFHETLGHFAYFARGSRSLSTLITPDDRTAALVVAIILSGTFAFQNDVRFTILYATMVAFLRSIFKTRLLLPPAVDHPSENNVLLIDILGSRISLPIELCSTPNDLHETLVRLFQGKRGLAFVVIHAYEIMKVGGSVAIDWDNWSTDVQPGRELEMGVVIRRRMPAKSINDSPRFMDTTCPRCGATRRRDALQYEARAWTECDACRGQFRFSPESPYEEERDPALPPLYEPDDGDSQGSDIAFLRKISVTWSQVLEKQNFFDSYRRSQPPSKPIEGAQIGGPSSNVHLGMNSKTGELLAIKRVKSSVDSAAWSIINNDADILRDLDHPNVVQYLGSELASASFSFYMEYVPGGSLASLIRTYGSFEEPLASNCASQIACGLEYIHSRSIIHRSLNAKHILLGNDGTCKIANFGAAVFHQEDEAHKPPALWDPYRTAPEAMYLGPRLYDCKIDIWSFGCVLLEMWTGERPWSGEPSRTVASKLHTGRQGPPIPAIVDHRRHALGLVKRCLAITPILRPSATDLRGHPYIVGQK